MNESETPPLTKRQKTLKNLFSEPEGLKKTTLKSAHGTPLLVLFYTTGEDGAPTSTHKTALPKGTSNTLTVDNSGYTIKTKPDGAGNYTQFHIPSGQGPNFKQWKIRRSKRNIHTEKKWRNAQDFLSKSLFFFMHPAAVLCIYGLTLGMLFSVTDLSWHVLIPTGIPLVLAILSAVFIRGWNAGAGALGSLMLLASLGYALLFLISAGIILW